MGQGCVRVMVDGVERRGGGAGGKVRHMRCMLLLAGMLLSSCSCKPPGQWGTLALASVTAASSALLRFCSSA